MSVHQQNRACQNSALPPTHDGRALRRYKQRWTVERTFAWLGNFRRLGRALRPLADRLSGVVSYRLLHDRLTDDFEIAPRQMLLCRVRALQTPSGKT